MRAVLLVRRRAPIVITIVSVQRVCRRRQLRCRFPGQYDTATTSSGLVIES